jgi:hypothetical protein
MPEMSESDQARNSAWLSSPNQLCGFRFALRFLLFVMSPSFETSADRRFQEQIKQVKYLTFWQLG